LNITVQEFEIFKTLLEASTSSMQEMTHTPKTSLQLTYHKFGQAKFPLGGLVSGSS